MPKVDEVYESDWIKHADLKNRKVSLTIRHVKVEEAFGKQSFVLYFADTEKKLRLNATNARMLAMLTGKDDSDDWAGFRVTLKPDITTYAGEPKKTVSIDSELPPQPSRTKGQAAAADPFAGAQQTETEDDEIPF